MLQLAAVRLANRGASDANTSIHLYITVTSALRRGRITMSHSYEPIVINTKDQRSSIGGSRSLVGDTEHFTMANKLLLHVSVFKKTLLHVS
jgi:hypothetical protein